MARALPAISVLRERCRALAILEVILNPDPTTRYFAFDASRMPQVELASMSNGAGDDWSIVFSPAGAFLRGFDHESPMSPAANDDEVWPGLIDTVPAVFSTWVTEPEFQWDGVLRATVCLWREHGDDRWRAGDPDLPGGDDPDGADWLFQVPVDGSPVAYQEFAEAYYETTVDVEAVADVFAGRPPTAELVHRLHPGRVPADLAADLAVIGRPPRPV